MASTPRPKAIRAGLEVSLPLGLERRFHDRLHGTVEYGGNAERPKFPVRLRDVDSSGRFVVSDCERAGWLCANRWLARRCAPQVRLQTKTASNLSHGERSLREFRAVHLIHVSSLSARASTPYPAGYGFPVPFGSRPSLLGSSCPRRGIGLPCGWLTAGCRQTSTGFPCSA
jgi:hypothetical protein